MRAHLALLPLLACGPNERQIAVSALSEVLPPPFLSAPRSSTSGRISVAWGESRTRGVDRYELEQTTDGETWTSAYAGKELGIELRLVVDVTVGLRVRACVSSTKECSSFTPVVTVTVTPTFPDYLTDTCDPIPVTLPPQENVGTIAAEPGVSGGAASVRIPIAMAPGRRGVQPSVALAYDSRSGNELAGMGFSLSGTSRIHRCGRTPVHDGTLANVDFTASDRLCLDGERLIVVSGSYGATGSSYRTETDRFARITLSGGMDSATSWFTVEQKSGEIEYYGAYLNTNAVESYDAIPLSWWLRQREDRQGNSILFSYSRISGHFLLSGIDYTGVSRAAGDRSILFEYEARPDKSTRWVAGKRMRTTQRLSAITSRYQARVVRRYELSYSISRATGRSLLTALKECTSSPCNDATSLPVTSFHYQDEPPSYAEEVLPDGDGENVLVFLGADYEGDGTRDTIRREYEHPWGGDVISHELTLSSELAAGLPPRDIRGSDCERGLDMTYAGFPGWGNTDFDQDGRADLLGVRADGTFVVCDHQGNVKTSQVGLVGAGQVVFHTGDFDGNGMSDLLVRENGQAQVILQCPPTAANQLDFCDYAAFPSLAIDESVVNLNDYDGNGLPDVFVDWSGAYAAPSSYVPKIVFTTIAGGAVTFTVRDMASLGGPSGSFASSGGRRGWFDLNQDNLLDIYNFRNTAGPLFWVNTGSGFARATVSGTFSLPLQHFDDVILMDWDTDGITEILLPTNILLGWCYLYDRGNAEPIEYCSTNSSIDFFTSGAPHHLDRTIYQYDALEFADDGAGAFTVTRIPTQVAAPLGSQADDYFGDGLADVKYRLKRTFAQRAAEDPVPLGDWTAPPAGQPGRPWTGYGNKVMRNLGPAPDLLVTVEDGLGSTASWDYAPLSSDGVAGCLSPQEIPFYRANHEAAPDDDHFFFASSMLVVGRFERSNGVGGTNPTCYRYQDAMFNTQGRGFLGFRKIVEEQTLADDDDLRTTTTFEQKFPLISAMVESTTHLASDPLDALPLERTTQHWTTSCAAAGHCFSQVDQSVKETRDLISRAWISTTTTSMGYAGSDLGYGNPSWEEKRFEDRSTRYSERTDYRFDYREAGDWWIERLAEKVVTTRSADYVDTPRVPAPAHPENADKVVTTTYDYHPSSDAARARLPRWKRVSGRGADEWVETEFSSYDSYGNVTQSRDSAALLPRARSVSRTYTSDGYFVATETRPHGHRSSYTTDPETGLVTWKEAPNGNISSKTLDDFGRVLETSEPGVAVSRARVLGCSPQSCPPNARYRKLMQRDGAPSVTQFFDGLGRAIETRRTAFDGVSQIVETVELDARGRTVRISQPSDQPGGAYYTELQGYDALGRPGRKVVDKTGYVNRQGQPDEAFVTEYFYSGLKTIIRLDGQLTASRTHNVLGQLIETVDAAGGRTRYRYDGRGLLILIEDAAGNQTRVGFDDLGHRRWISDPDRGQWSFTPNGLGELSVQTDANGETMGLVYDDLGRIIERQVNGARESSWTYDLTAAGTLDVESKLDPGTGQTLFTRTFGYDRLFRETRRTTSFDGQSYEIERAYDCQGLLWGIEYPNGEALELDYSPHGYLLTEKNPLGLGSGELYREVRKVDARGSVLEERFGNGLFGRYDYFDSTGQVRRLRVCSDRDPSCAQPLQDLDYGYEDSFGNLTHQLKRLGAPAGVAYSSVREDYQYDQLQRLVSSTRTWSGPGAPALVTVGYAYDALGNLLRKDDYATSYAYGANAGPHAVTSIDKIGGGTVSFRYDGNGNLVDGDGRQLTYTFANKPATITEGAVTTSFLYDPNHQRYRQESGGRITRYVDELYESIDTPALDEEKAYLGSSVVVTRSSAGRTVRWLHRDRLGSIETVTGSSGRVEEVLSYDAFGAPRSSTWEDNGRLHGSTTTTRGFTDHEHLDEHGLIHMNGRGYDPGLGRFLSVDPFVQELANGQSLNPYSYILNNPLSGVDPSGYLSSPDIEVRARNVQMGANTADVNLKITFNDDGKGALVSGTINVSNGTSYAFDIEVSLGSNSSPSEIGKNVTAFIGAVGSALGEFARPDETEVALLGTGMLAAAADLALPIGDVYLGGVVAKFGATRLGRLPALLSRIGDEAAEYGPKILDDLAPGLRRAADDAIEGAKSVLACPCFAAGTLVLTESGLRPIESIRIGDRVLAQDEATGEQAYQPVTMVFVTPEQPTLLLELDAEPIETTPGHPFWVLGRGWVPAKELVRGDAIQTAEGGLTEVIASTPLETRATVFNLEVDAFHSYFVGETGAWVHNNNCNCAAQGPDVLRPSVNELPSSGGRFIADPKGNILVEPPGGATVGNQIGTFVETRYPNGSPAQQLHGAHRGYAQPHGHGFEPGAGVNQRGPSLDPEGNRVSYDSPSAHWPVRN